MRPAHVLALAPESSTTTVYHMPDGSKKTEVKTVNPDGSITVKETIEQLTAPEQGPRKV